MLVFDNRFFLHREHDAQVITTLCSFITFGGNQHRPTWSRISSVIVINLDVRTRGTSSARDDGVQGNKGLSSASPGNQDAPAGSAKLANPAGITGTAEPRRRS